MTEFQPGTSGIGAEGAARPGPLRYLENLLISFVLGCMVVIPLAEIVLRKRRNPLSGHLAGEQARFHGRIRNHADAVLAASIFHYGEYTVGDAKRHMAAHGIEVRL
jgi:hypothetical protein